MLSNLRLRAKLLLLALGPILLLTIMLSGIAVYELRNLAEQQEEHTRQSLISDRRAELQNYVQLARNALAPIYDASADGDMQARDQAVAILERLSYGKDGYDLLERLLRICAGAPTGSRRRAGKATRCACASKTVSG